MNLKSIIVCLICLAAQLSAQNQLPPAVKSAIPSRYTITYELFVKSDFIANADISLELPAKNSCNDGMKGVCEIKVSLISYDQSQKEIINLLEQQMPFASRLPSEQSFKPTVNPHDELVSYSKTTTASLPKGKATYYTAKHTCIMDQHESYTSVHLTSLQGNAAFSIGIDISGGIDSGEALAVVKELYGILSKYNFNAL